MAENWNLSSKSHKKFLVNKGNASQWSFIGPKNGERIQIDDSKIEIRTALHK